MSCKDWAFKTDKMKSYHDNEWGKPTHDDRLLYEYLFLECMQAGLNWNMMIEKREIFRNCFDNFDFVKISKYSDKDIDRIFNTKGMIKSERKIRAMINNAQKFCEIINDYNSFDAYLWSFTGGKTYVYKSHDNNLVVSNELSDKLSKDLKKRGIKYMGTVTAYSYLQAAGLINDHSTDCPEYSKIIDTYPCEFKQ